LKYYGLFIYWLIGYVLLLWYCWRNGGISVGHIVGGALLAWAWPIGLLGEFNDKIIFNNSGGYR
jgi:hypothetical protein